MPVDERIKPTSGTLISPGGIRQLTLGEIALARTLFGGSLIYSKIGYTVKAIYLSTCSPLVLP